MKSGKSKSARKVKGLEGTSAREGHPSLGAGHAAGWEERLTDSDLQFIAQALTSGALIAPTPFEELELEHPALWQRARQVFGNPEAARSWLETRSERFGGQRPLSVAMRTGGEKKVMRELNRLGRE